MRPALSPCMIGTCKIENRFVMTAANLGYCRDGYVTDEVIAFYRERARGKTGLIIAGAAGVDPERVNRTGMMQIYDDSHIGPMKRLTDAVHRQGSKIFLQLMHAGAYAKQSEHQGRTAAAPSAYLCGFTKEETHELTAHEITCIVSYFKNAAVRARSAGFDGIELMGSAGYLISEFLSGATNRRQDQFGGGLRERAGFLIRIMEAVREGVGKEYPMIVRLSGSDFVPGGNGIDDFLEIGRMIEGYIDGIDVTGGWHESGIPQITYHVPRGMYLYLARAMKETVSVPVIGCNRLDLNRAVRAVENGDCHMAGMLRGFIADPYLVRKYMDGHEASIRPCLACNEQCLDRIFAGKKLECSVNCLAGRENLVLKPADEGKNILVIGAGISGMAYGAMAAGHNRVTVWEKEMTCAGAGLAVAKLPYRQDVLAYIRYLFKTCGDRGVVFRFGTSGTRENIRNVLEQGIFDRVVLAAGCTLDVPEYGISPEALILSGRPVGRNTVIIGSGYKAVQTAQYCAVACKEGEEEEHFLEQYKCEDIKRVNNIMRRGPASVTLLSPEKRAGRGVGRSIRWTMLNDIKQKGVNVVSGAEIRGIFKDRVTYLWEGQEKTVMADMVIIGRGWQKNMEFVPLTDEMGDRITVIGDAGRPGRITDAIKDAFKAAMKSEEDNYV